MNQDKNPPFKPVVTFPTISVPQADGSYLVRPGKPTIHGTDKEYVSTADAAKILGLSLRRIETLCEEGRLTWTRIGERGNYRISIQSIIILTTTS
jgi:excisionase family DNA binding protein